MKLSQMLGRKMNEIPCGPDYSRPHPHSSVGIEVELEGIRGWHHRTWKRWSFVKDGSTHNGIEFVSEPVWGTAITDALDELDDYLQGQEPHVSFRTSVHVHVNVLDMTKEQIAHMIRLYLIYEPALFKLHDKWNRSNNIFCVPAQRSVAIQRGYAKMIRHLENGGLDEEYLASKYSALNINCIRSFGTLEFRHMGGTAEMGEVSSWIDVLLQLKVAALLDEPLYDPREVWGDQYDKLDITDDDLNKGKIILDYLTAWR